MHFSDAVRYLMFSLSFFPSFFCFCFCFVLFPRFLVIFLTICLFTSSVLCTKQGIMCRGKQRRHGKIVCCRTISVRFLVFLFIFRIFLPHFACCWLIARCLLSIVYAVGTSWRSLCVRQRLKENCNFPKMNLLARRFLICMLMPTLPILHPSIHPTTFDLFSIMLTASANSTANRVFLCVFVFLFCYPYFV